MPLRGDRVRRYVNAYCPRCHDEHPERPLAEVARLSGWLAERDGRVWLERGCPDHGLVRTLYDESAEILAYLEQWTAPTKVHAPDLAGIFGRAIHLSDGRTLIADEPYLRDSILLPKRDVVAGYEPIMPSFQGVVSEGQLMKLLAYLKSLSINSEAQQ